MGQYEEILEREKAYLKKVTLFLKEQLELSGEHISKQRKSLIELRREMLEEGAKYTDELDRAAELNQYLTMEAVETTQYQHKLEKIRKYERMIDKPYFGRFDFTEEDEYTEEIYIGYGNIMNDDTYEVLVYDW